MQPTLNFPRFQQPISVQDYALAQNQTIGANLPGLEKDQQLFKGDVKTEAHFIGQIIGGTDFPSDEGLFCEMIIQAGESWELLSPPKLFQTQTSYCNLEKIFIWSHPLDLHYATSDIIGWPKAHFRVWRLDTSNKMDPFAYGVLNFPKSSGFHVLECETWSPISDWKSTSMSFFMGTNPRVLSLETVAENMDKREILSTATSGKVIMELEVVLRNFGKLGISGQNQDTSRV